jgi:hypothetical protein
LDRLTDYLLIQLAVASQYRVVNGPPTPFGSNCQILPIVQWAPVCYASSVLFDIVIVIFSLIKLKANTSATTSGVGYIAYRDSLLYFFATAITNIAVLAIQALGQNSALIKPAAVPFSTVIVTAMASRVFLNLKLFHQRRTRALLPGPINSSQNTSREYRTGDTFGSLPMQGYPCASDVKSSPFGASYPSPSVTVDIVHETFGNIAPGNKLG